MNMALLWWHTVDQGWNCTILYFYVTLYALVWHFNGMAYVILSLWLSGFGSVIFCDFICVVFWVILSFPGCHSLLYFVLSVSSFISLCGHPGLAILSGGPSPLFNFLVCFTCLRPPTPYTYFLSLVISSHLCPILFPDCFIAQAFPIVSSFIPLCHCYIPQCFSLSLQVCLILTCYSVCSCPIS